MSRDFEGMMLAGAASIVQAFGVAALLARGSDLEAAPVVLGGAAALAAALGAALGWRYGRIALAFPLFSILSYMGLALLSHGRYFTGWEWGIAYTALVAVTLPASLLGTAVASAKKVRNSSS